MDAVLLNEIYGDAIKTIIALIVVFLLYGLFDLIYIRRVDSLRQRRKLRIRASYVVSFILMFVMARIWVDGFTHLLAVLGLVSAALVITNKETIMNLVGWLIISWRGLFAEDDLIQVQQYKGYVKKIGLLYFSLAEVSESDRGNVTGRLIKVPNGLVTANVLMNYSQKSSFSEQVFAVVFNMTNDVEYAIEFMSSLINTVLADFYQNNQNYSEDYLNKNFKELSSHISLQTRTSVQLKYDNPAGIKILAHYYCFANDADQLQQVLHVALLNQLKHEKKLQLSYEC